MDLLIAEWKDDKESEGRRQRILKSGQKKTNKKGRVEMAGFASQLSLSPLYPGQLSVT